MPRSNAAPELNYRLEIAGLERSPAPSEHEVRAPAPSVAARSRTRSSRPGSSASTVSSRSSRNVRATPTRLDRLRHSLAPQNGEYIFSSDTGHAHLSETDRELNNTQFSILAPNINEPCLFPALSYEREAALLDKCQRNATAKNKAKLHLAKGQLNSSVRISPYHCIELLTHARSTRHQSFILTKIPTLQ